MLAQHVYIQPKAVWYLICVRLTPENQYPGQGFIQILGGESDGDDTLTLARAGRAARVSPVAIYFETTKVA